MKYAYYIMIILLLSTTVMAETPTEQDPNEGGGEYYDDNAKLYVEVSTDKNLDLLLVGNSNKSIDNTIICNSPICNTNIEGGDLQIPNNQTFNYNQYITHYINRMSSGGFSIGTLIYQLGSVVDDYMNSRIPQHKNDAWNLWELLDSVFVSHKEFYPTQMNTLYLADEMDRVRAENSLLREYLGIEIDPQVLECRTAINKARRTGQEVRTPNGWIANPSFSGEQCFRID